MAKKASGRAAVAPAAKKVSKRLVATRDPQMHVAHRIQVLLHTMRVIERHEEQLCVLMTEIRSAGEVSAATGKELRVLLEELPGDAYQADLEAVEAALEAAAGAVPKAAPKKRVARTGRKV
jgi:hypothetical protein